jgi:hypothetical protein
MPTTIETSKESGHPFGEVTAAVKEQNVRALLKPGAAVVAEDLSGTGFTYRHDWGNKHGQWKLTLNWGAVNHNSRVFVSTSEFGGGQQVPFVGAARYTVHNVAPFDGGVVVWINIEWGSDIRVQLSYLVVNP